MCMLVADTAAAAAAAAVLQGLASRTRRDILRRTWVPTGKLQVRGCG